MAPPFNIRGKGLDMLQICVHMFKKAVYACIHNVLMCVYKYIYIYIYTYIYI